MASEIDETTSTVTYELTCTDCSFEMLVDGSVYDALAEAKNHREEHGKPFAEHFVEFELVTNRSKTTV